MTHWATRPGDARCDGPVVGASRHGHGAGSRARAPLLGEAPGCAGKSSTFWPGWQVCAPAPAASSIMWTGERSYWGGPGPACHGGPADAGVGLDRGRHQWAAFFSPGCARSGQRSFGNGMHAGSRTVGSTGPWSTSSSVLVRSSSTCSTTPGSPGGRPWCPWCSGWRWHTSTAGERSSAQRVGSWGHEPRRRGRPGPDRASGPGRHRPRSSVQRSAPAGRTSQIVHRGRYPCRGQNTEDNGLGGL